VSCQGLFRYWSTWAVERGHRNGGSEAVFGRNLRAIVPAMERKQVRKGHNREYMYQGIAARPLP
jgi:hypothetical protein